AQRGVGGGTPAHHRGDGRREAGGEICHAGHASGGRHGRHDVAHSAPPTFLRAPGESAVAPGARRFCGTLSLTALSPSSNSQLFPNGGPFLMFQSLGEKFDSLLRKLQGQGRITERNIEEALRDVRLALLEADVNLDVVRDFVEAVKRDALGEEVLRSLTPEQHFIKLVHRELVRALERLVAAVRPGQVLLVADAMTGQDAVATAQGFAGRLPVSGVILTKIEGDARGGAALSLRAVTGKPIVFVGTGEKLEALEAFHPERVASRILGMGDVLSL